MGITNKKAKSDEEKEADLKQIYKLFKTNEED